MQDKTWFITGSSRGFGRALVEAALAAGDQVVATARRPEQLADLVDAHADARAARRPRRHRPGRRASRAATPASPASAASTSSSTTPATPTSPRSRPASDDDFRAQFETNFWGVYHVSKAAIPRLREQGGGLIVQFSSVGGRVGGSPGIASYQAAKFAVDGFTRVLAAETAPFGIRTMVVEPSGFATDWAGSSMTVHDIPDDYDATIGAMQRRVRANAAGPAGDPARAAEIIVAGRVKRRDPRRTCCSASTPSTWRWTTRSSQLAEATAWEQRQPLGRLRRALPGRVPARQAGGLRARRAGRSGQERQGIGVTGADHCWKSPAIKGGDFGQAETFGHGDHRSVGGPERKAGVGDHQLSHP